MRQSNAVPYSIEASITPYIEDNEPKEESAIQAKQIASIRKSKILKELIKHNKCGFISEEMLREDATQAFNEASNFCKPPSLFNVRVSVRTIEEE
jgi:hypothetical protein